MERFCDGLDGKLYERLNLLEQRVSISLWTRLYPKRMLWKRHIGTRRGRLVLLWVAKLTRSFPLWKGVFLTHTSNLQLDAGRWSLPRANLQGTSSSATLSSRLQSLMHLHVTSVIATVSIVVSQGTTSVIAPSPSKTSPTHRIKVQETSLSLWQRSQWCKSAKASWTSPPWVTSQKELQCSWVHSLSMTLLLRFYLILELPTVFKGKANRQNGFDGFSYQFSL
jgi:hypothetical protein